MSIQFQ
jgi:hypothetical protein